MSNARTVMQLPSYQVYRAVSEALSEDLGRAGDVTTNSTIPENSQSEAVIHARQSGVIAGSQFVEAAIKTFDHDAIIRVIHPDGHHVAAGDPVIEINARTRAILTGERTGLNYLGHLSGVASLTSQFVKEIEGTNAQICCTRKTTPGLRAFEKYAVRAGGGVNHRFGLDDAILIKDNHIAGAGGVSEAIEAALSHAGHMLKIEIEVDNLDQLRSALKYPIDAVLLDNMSDDDRREAVQLINASEHKIITEASGGVSLETVKSIAETGVDLISVGALTHSAPSLDFGLDFPE